MILVVGIILVSLAPFVNSYIFKLIIDRLVLSIQQQSVDLSPFVPLLLISIGLGLFDRVLSRILEYYERILHLDFERYITMVTSRKFSSLGFEHYSKPKTNDLLIRVNENTWRPTAFGERQLWTIQNIVEIVSNTAAIITLNIWIFIGVLVASIPEFLIRVKYGKEVWGIWDTKGSTKRHFWNTRYYLRSEWYRNEIAIFGARNYLLEKLKSLYQTFLDIQKQKEKGKLLLQATASIITTIIFGLSEVYIVISTLANNITLGSLNFYNSRMFALSRGFNSFFRNLGSSYEDLLYVEDLFTVLSLQNKVQNITNGAKIKRTPHTIEFINASFRYPYAKKFVLKNFNLTINPSEKVALIGENGGGKTTIIRLLCRFYDVTDGEILIDGINIKKIDIDSWYACLGVLFQDFNRYDYTVRENITLGSIDKQHEKELIAHAAKKSQASGFIDEYKKKFDTILSKQFTGGIDPSTGQWQKIALARAFFRDAPILILDEPTAAIDAKAEFEIFKQLEQFESDKTVIMISHRFSTVRNADTIYVIEGGKIIEHGSHSDLMKNGGKYKKMFSLQAKGYQ